MEQTSIQTIYYIDPDSVRHPMRVITTNDGVYVHGTDICRVFEKGERNICRSLRPLQIDLHKRLAFVKSNGRRQKAYVIPPVGLIEVTLIAKCSRLEDYCCWVLRTLLPWLQDRNTALLFMDAIPPPLSKSNNE